MAPPVEATPAEATPVATFVPASGDAGKYNQSAPLEIQ